LLNKLKPKSEFAKNVLTLMTGTTIAQAIPITISPILTRLYTPEDFGVFALFVAITSIFGSIANGRYELAIMLPKKDEDAINIMALGFIINVVLSLFLLFVVIIFHDNIVNLLNNKEISPWLYLVPVSVFLIGLFNLLNYFNNRKKFYKDLAKANIYKSIGMAIVQLILGFLKAGAFGLISGQIFSQIISNTKLFFNIMKLKLFKSIRKLKIIAVGKRYKKFPKYSLPSGVLNTISLQITPILLSSFFNASIVGFFSLSHRLISLPMSLIGGSIGQVFFQNSAQLIRDKEKLGLFVFNTFKKLVLISIIPFSIILIYGDILFSFVFGDKWIMAGLFAQILSLWLFFVFITSPLTTLLDTIQKQKEAMIFNFLIVVSRVSVLIIGGIFLKNEFITIALYTIVGVFFWIFWMFYVLGLVGIRKKDIIMLISKYLIPSILIFSFIRWLI